MNILNFSGYEQLFDFLCDTASEGVVSCAILDFEDTCNLLRECMCDDDVTVGSIKLEDEDYSGYKKEYYVTIDADFILDISPAWDKSQNKYTYTDADIYLFDGDVPSSILNLYQDQYCFEIEINDFNSDLLDLFDECEDCCEDCSDCDYLNENDLHAKEEAETSKERIKKTIDYLLNLL